MRVRVVHASRHGGTAGIAERIAKVLRSEGADLAVADAAYRPDAGGFDAYVIGSGVQIGSWLKEGTEFLERNRSTLAARPVCLFSSGPLPASSKMTEATDRVTLALAPEDGPGNGGRKKIEALSVAIRPREHRVFHGAARGTAVLAVAFALAGCGSSPAGVPSVAPSTVASIAAASPSTEASIAAASPSPAPTRRPAATSTPTTAPSASPQPSLAIKPLAAVFASKRTKVAWDRLTAAENALYDRHPEFESIVPRWNLIEQNLNDCGGVQPGAQRDMCGAVVWQDYLIYKQSGLDEAFSTTVLAYQWALGLGIDKTWLDGYVTKLVQG